MNDVNCIYCKSTRIIKRGIRKNKITTKQRYLCKDCNKRFITDIPKIKSDSKIVSLVLDLYYKGLSVRKIQQHLDEFYDITINYSTIYRYVIRFSKQITEFVNTKKITPTRVWNADETALHFNKRKNWLWNILDKESRFLVASHLTRFRFINEKKSVFTKSKNIVDGDPHIVMTDSFWGYRKLSKAVYPNTYHFRYTGIQSRENNNRIERLNSNVKERYKVMRGFKKIKTGQIIIDGWRNYYNFVRPHLGLNGITPAEAIGVDLKLQNNKWLSLLRQSLENK